MPKRRRRIRPTTEPNRALRTALLKRIRLLRLKERIRHTDKRADEIVRLAAELDAISPFDSAAANRPAGSIKNAAAIWAELAADEESARNA